MKSLLEDIKKQQFQHVYLLYGQEDYLKLQYRDRLLKALLPEDPGINLTLFDGDHLTEGAVIDQAETLPFFSDRRVIRLDHTGLFKTSAELLPDYLKSLPDYLYLVFTESEVDRRSRLFKAVQSAGRCVEFTEQSESTLTAWILRMLDRESLKIRPSDMEHLLERTGTDMNRIALEADKLIHYCLETGISSVTREAIDAVTSDLPEDRIFDMIQALTEHRRGDVMELYADLLALKEPPMRTLSLIANQYGKLLTVKELAETGLADGQIAAKAGMPPFAVRRNRKLLKHYSTEQLRAIRRLCVETDEAIKTGRLTDRLAVELLLIRLSEKGSADPAT